MVDHRERLRLEAQAGPPASARSAASRLGAAREGPSPLGEWVRSQHPKRRRASAGGGRMLGASVHKTAPSFALLSPAANANPYPIYAQAREAAALQFDTLLPGWVATTHQAVAQ